MGYLDEYYKLKKKREEQMQKSSKSSSTSTSADTSTDSPYLNTYNQLKAEREAKIDADLMKMSAMANNDSDIGPVIVSSKDKKEETEKKKWFNSGLFGDGYQFGDVTKTILGTGADLAEDALTGIIGMGEKIVDAGAFVAPYIAQGQFYQNGGVYQPQAIQKAQNDMYAQARKEAGAFIKNDLYDENAIAKRLLSEVPGAMQMSNINQAGGYATAQDWERNRQMQKESQKYIDNTMEDASVLGDKSDALVQSAGQLVATAGLQAVGVPWWLTTGATSFGAEAENALKQGATYEEAGLSATITAGAEILTEKISGGIKFGGKTLDEGLTRQLSRVITDKTIRTLSKVGMDVVGEGGEEVLSGYLSAIGQKLTYADEKEMSELFSSEDALDAFIGGAILGGVSSTGQAIAETNKGNDYASGLTNSEKAVVDKVYQDAIAEKEADGKKLTQSQKSKIYDDTLKALEKGYIDTDTIESVLGGESYNNYKSTVDSEDALMKEYEELGNTQNPTLAQTSRYNALEQQIKEMKEKSNRTQLREKLDNDMLGLVQNTKLAESYNEKSRRSQVFEADLTQYDSKQAEVVKKAVESGILNNTNKTHDFVDWIARVSAEKGVSFDFMNNKKLKESGFAVDGKTVNGFVKDGNVTLNIDSAKSLNSVVGHEITHVLEGTEFMPELQNVLFELAKTKGEYDTRLQALTKLYEGVEGANVEAELTADLVGDYLFTDADFINSLSTQHRNVFQKIYDEIKYLYKVATAGSKEAKELEKVKKAFEKAYRESGKATSDTKYSLNKVTDEKVADRLTPSEWKFIKSSVGNHKNLNYSYQKSADGDIIIPVGNKLVYTDANYDSPGISKVIEFESEYENDIDMAREEFYAVEKAESTIEEAYELVRLFTKIENINEYETENRANDGKYDRRTSRGKGQSDTFHNNFLQERIRSANEIIHSVNNENINQNGKASSKDGVFFDAQKDGVKYSISDSDGKQLSEDQQNYFKDSKVRDDNGNLKVMYHGTEKGGFHKFNPDYANDGRSLFFTDSPTVAKAYSGTHDTYAAKTFKTAEDFNRFFKEISATEYRVVEENGKFTLFDGEEEVATTDTAAALYEEFRDWSGVGYGSTNYQVYLNLKNPLIVDAKGENWDSLEMADYDNDQETIDVYEFYVEQTGWDLEKDVPKFQVEAETSERTYDEEMYEEDIYKHFGRSFAEDLVSRAKDDFEGYSIWKNHRINKDTTKNLPSKTRDFAEYAMERGYDGVIFKNIVDNGLYAANMERFATSTVAVAFDSNQVKSVDNSNPTSDPDIRYSLSEDADSLEDIKAKYKDKTDHLYLYEKNDTLSIDNLVVKKEYRNQGIGTQILKDVMSYADKTGKTITLTPTSEFGTKEKLKKWYKSHGFVENKGKNTNFLFRDTMYRLPQSDVRYSLSEDSEGRKLSKDQQEYFKGSKVVDEKGRLAVAYHGSPAEFTVFDKNRIGKGTDQFGAGFYFGTTSEIAEAYGGNQYEVYLNIRNPIKVYRTLDGGDLYGVEITKKQAYEIIKRHPMIYDAEESPLGDFVEAYWEEGAKDWMIKEMASQYTTIGLLDGDLFRDYPNELHEAIRDVIGYDGVEVTFDNTDSKFYIAWFDNQMKLTSNVAPTVAQDIRFSMSEHGEQIAPVGNYNVFGKDIALEQDIGPVMEAAPTTEAVEPSAEVYAPLTEEDANERDDAQIDRKYFLDEMAPEPEAHIYSDDIAPESPFDDRDYETIGNRKIKAYMYENPEVKPFFQEEAWNMLHELSNSQKGERGYNDDLYYETNGEMGFYGVKRHTSEDIAYLLDKKLDSYADIERGLKAIIEDHGEENNATSKRIEFLLDERLRSGYRDFFTGERIPPNQEYLNLLTEKQITEYNDEAWDNYLRGLSQEDMQQYFGPEEEIAPPVETKNTAPIEDAPVREDLPLHEDASGQQSMFEVEDAETEPTITRSSLHGSIIENIKSAFNKRGFDFDDVLNKAKNLSTFATVDNTPQRVIEKALGYKQGQVLNDLTVNKVAENETEGTKWLDSFTNRKNGLLAQISKQYNIKPGSKKSAAAQMYAEGFYVDEDNNIIAYGNEELAKDFPKYSDRADIRGLARDPRIRKIYDDTLAMINASRKRNAYPEIPRLDNYFLHFRAMDDTFSRLGLPFNPNDIRAKDLPTDLNGVTADLKPGQPYFASAMHRTGKRTSFDLLGGLERYLSSAKNQIYHIDDIQTLRALRNYIADTYGQAKGLEGLDALTEEEAQERIEEVYGSHLSTFAKFLNEEANVIAGKTTLIDRGLEGVIGRRGITFLDTINRQVGANMVGFNISSSLTNFLPVAQTFAKTNKADFVKAFAQTVSNKIGSVFGRNDGFAEQSPVMIRRKGADRFYRTPWQKLGDAGYVFMGAVDSISTELITRTKYNELTRKGMDSQKAHYETDKWVSRMMGDRSLGQQPQLYNSKMLGIFTKFQLEVRNQLDSQFYDTIQEAKVSNEDIQNGLARNAKTAAKVTSAFVQLAVVQHLFGKAFESVAGYNPAFDIIAAILKAVGYDDDEESEDTVLDNLEQGFLELLGDLPYTSTFTGGRIPIASALPVEQFITGKDDYGNEKSRLETIKEAAPYYVLPAGYGQIKKTYQGLSMFDDDLPIAGSYTDSGNLRFPVEDTLQNRVQAGVFGQWASDNARDYFDNERNPLKEKQIEELVDLDIPIADYWKYREGLAEQETLEDKFDYIADLDVSVEQKNIMINNVVDRKEKVDMSNYDDFSGYDEFDFYANNTDKYNFLEENGVSYSEYISDKEKKKEYDEAYTWYKKNPEKVTVSKAVTDNVIEYRRFVSELDDIQADKDADGKKITGSAKEKKIEYINNLDLDYGQRIILFRSLYKSQEDKATYNADIVEYLNGRDDISYEEMVTILEELDFKVYPDGTVEW